MRVLFLTPWYPSANDAMLGLFVQKHAEAVRALGVDVQVIFSQSWRGTWRQWRALRRIGWMPDIVQLNVVQKQGALALWLKQHFHIPYIIIEHWSGYLPENGQFKQLHLVKKRFMRRVCSEAESVWTVSQPLQQAMQNCGMKAKQWGTIDNVVDDFFFQKPNSTNHSLLPPNRKILLHISCFDERAKNVTGLLRAAKMLSERRKDWLLVLVGTGIDYQECRHYADALGLIQNDLVHFTGEQTPQQVAEWMYNADALVLSSRYETYGVVLAEAAAARLPILSTPVGIAQELSDLIVPQEIAQNKPGRFAEFMETILWSKEQKPKSNDTANRFSAQTIGAKLKSIYDSSLHNNL